MFGFLTQIERVRCLFSRFDSNCLSFEFQNHLAKVQNSAGDQRDVFEGRYYDPLKSSMPSAQGSMDNVADNKKEEYRNPQKFYFDAVHYILRHHISLS